MRKFQISDKFTSADIGLEIEGSSIEELFLAGTEGMLAIIFGRPMTGEVESEFVLELQAGDREQLLVDWLSELLYFFDADGWIPVKVNLNISDDGIFRLRAEIGCCRYNKDNDSAEHEIKAVTYHRLQISHDSGVYSCHVVFDL